MHGNNKINVEYLNKDLLKSLQTHTGMHPPILIPIHMQYLNENSSIRLLSVARKVTIMILFLINQVQMKVENYYYERLWKVGERVCKLPSTKYPVVGGKKKKQDAS